MYMYDCLRFQNPADNWKMRIRRQEQRETIQFLSTKLLEAEWRSTKFQMQWNMQQMFYALTFIQIKDCNITGSI